MARTPSPPPISNIKARTTRGIASIPVNAKPPPDELPPLLESLVVVAGVVEVPVVPSYVNWSAELVAEVTPPTVTVTSTMSTVPDPPAGLVAVQLVVELQVTDVAGVAPKLIVAPVVESPVLVMLVPLATPDV
jgi:hypothetical protein